VDYENVVEIIDLLTSTAKLTAGQEEYLDALSTFVEVYEAREFPIEKGPPQEILKFLLESNGMTPADLSKLLGDDSRSLGTRLLSGERQLSKAHITTLCKHFGVSADLFF
jgi:HTH-type transcriptional regulator/antitoxin HigA